jgi:RHS repeat-associated protein
MPRFTGKERDSETGLDYFGARYFSAAQGRFTSPDWSEKPEPIPYADLKDPQTLNLYSYIHNNPLSKADPDGHDALWVVDKKAGTITLVIPVNFTGSGASKKTVEQIIKRDETLFIPGSGATIKVISTKEPINGVLNHMDVSPGNDLKNFPLTGEGVNRVGGNEGHINSSNADTVGATAHDVLHFAGLEDKYVGSSLGRACSFCFDLRQVGGFASGERSDVVAPLAVIGCHGRSSSYRPV